ncbi:MAG: Hpt domain-containing protein [Deltaproteobacteria bacterium]|jgi:HPt (histidine-containing phosphotransfer) domain-containing protein|nr:Hpt domain-containing protein [Deltaproteobacteria bacterium]MCW8892922.1 Hpt domain-containing protein [Deltaproteobacteria bacterium]
MPIDDSAIEMLHQIQPADKPGFVTRMIKLYQTSTQTNIAQLQEVYAINNLEQLTGAAHTLKSSNANIGAMEIASVAEELERDCRRNNLAYCNQQITVIVQEFNRVGIYFNDNFQ